MLAKPEYFSLPDEACCRPGRCGGEVGRYAAAESHREDVAGRGAVAELLVRAASGSSWRERRGRDGAKRQSVRKSLPLGERRCGGIEEELAAGRATMRLHRGKACRWARTMQLHQEGAEQHREELSSIGKRLNGSNQHFTPFLFQCHKPHTAIPIIIKYKRAA